MNQHSQYTTDRLEAIRRTKNWSARIAWVSAVLAVVGMVVLGLALADYRVSLPKPVREAGVAVSAAIILFALFRLWQLVRRAGDAKKMALELEERQPGLGCVVSTAVQYQAGDHLAHDYEPELVAALQEQAAQRLRTVETPWFRGKSIWAAVVLGAVMVALAAFVLWKPEGVTALERVTLPWANVTYTHVRVAPGSTEIATGHDLPVTADFFGRPPQNPRLLWRISGTPEWRTITLGSSGHGRCTNLLTNIKDAIVYKVAGGDAVSPEYLIVPFNPPEIKAVATTVNLPAYTQHPPVEETTPDLRVVRGSELTVRVAVSDGVTDARLIIANQSPAPLTRDAHGQWTTQLTAAKSLDYRIELTGADGRKGGNDTPYHLVVVPDEPPRVEITEPGEDIRADPTNKVPVKIAVNDDFGVTSIKLVYQKLGDPEQTVVCHATNLNQPEAKALTEIDLAPLHLQPYEVVSYHAEATDNNTLDGPGIGKSPVYFIEFTTKDQPVAESHSQAQKINLLELEKQIIAATTAVPEDKIKAQLPDVAATQRQTKEYADTFRNNSPILAQAPPEARQEFDAALVAMGGAATSLDDIQRDPALSSEGNALKHMYQAVRLFPELKPCMCNCTGIKIVAEAVEKKHKAEQKKRGQTLPDAVAKAKHMAAVQAALNGIYRKSSADGLSGLAKSEAPAKNPGAASANGQKPGPNGQMPGGQNGSGTGGDDQQENLSDQPPGTGKPGDDTPKPDAEEQNQIAAAPSAAQLKLAEEASKLAATLHALVGNDPRISSRYSQQLQEIAGQMRQAGGFVTQKAFGSATVQGNIAFGGLESIAGELEILAHEQPEVSDAAAEEYPKAYGQRISDYLRTLSYQK